MKYIRHFLLITLSILTLFSCKEGGKNKQIFMPSVNGKAGDVLIVIDKEYWESELGSELKSTLASEYPYLPQREPMFTVYNTTPSSFNGYGSFVSYRNILMVNIDKSFKESKITYQEDVWAAPQIVITVSAPDKDSAYDIITKDKEKIIGAIEQKERDRIITNVHKYQEIAIRDMILADFGGSPYFPQGYSIKKHIHGFSWISYETTYVNQGIFVYSYPYTGEEITLASVVDHRNEVLKQNVPGMRDNSYMTTSTMIMPGFKWIKYKNRTFAEVRGLWEVEGDYMGGPFVSHVFLDKDNKNVIVLEGFVYAPKFDKRNYLRHVESVLYSFEWGK